MARTFRELLNPTTTSSPVPELQVRTETTLDHEDVLLAVNRLKSGKAAGPDDIRPEMLKALDEHGIA